jgi:hypothetical protein
MHDLPPAPDEDFFEADDSDHAMASEIATAAFHRHRSDKQKAIEAAHDAIEAKYAAGSIMGVIAMAAIKAIVTKLITSWIENKLSAPLPPDTEIAGD